MEGEKEMKRYIHTNADISKSVQVGDLVKNFYSAYNDVGYVVRITTDDDGERFVDIQLVDESGEPMFMRYVRHIPEDEVTVIDS